MSLSMCEDLIEKDILNAKEAFNKIQYHFLIKVLDRTGMEGTHLFIEKGNIQQNNSQHQTEEKLKAIQLKS